MNWYEQIRPDALIAHYLEPKDFRRNISNYKEGFITDTDYDSVYKAFIGKDNNTVSDLRYDTTLEEAKTAVFFLQGYYVGKLFNISFQSTDGSFSLGGVVIQFPLYFSIGRLLCISGTLEGNELRFKIIGTDVEWVQSNYPLNSYARKIHYVSTLSSNNGSLTTGFVCAGFWSEKLTDEELDQLNFLVREQNKVSVSSDSLRNSKVAEKLTTKDIFQNFYSIPLNPSYIYSNSKASKFKEGYIQSQSGLAYESTSYNIEDMVYKEGVPTKTKLFCYDRKLGTLLRSTYSNSDGKFKFSNIRNGLEVFVTSCDGSYQFNSIIKDYL